MSEKISRGDWLHQKWGAADEQFFEKLLPFFTLFLLLIVLAITSGQFRRQPLDNILTVLSTSSIYVVAAAGMTMVIVSGGIDLSVGSVIAFSGIVGALVAQECAAAWGAEPGAAACLAGAAAGIAAGALAGLLNGLAICLLRIPPFIATLGSMGIFRGVALLLTAGQPVSPVPSGFSDLWYYSINLGVAVPVAPLGIMAVVVVSFSYLMRCTLLGRYTYAIGSNAEAAKLSGIRIDRHLLKVYTLHGALAGLAGMMLVAKLKSGQPSEGVTYELYIIAAVVIGGGSLAGGVGTVGGALIGTLIMQFLYQGCILLNIDDYWQKVIIGVIVIAAVAFDQYRRRVRASAG